MYRDKVLVISWTDNTPHTSGNYLILRTVGSQAQYDDVQANKVSLSYLHGDHLGSNSLMTDATGTIVPNSQAAYLPFGDWRNEPSTADLTDVGYTGHRHNNTATNDLGLIYMNARYYVPGIGRFASADTIIPDPLNPQSHNRFSYVHNNPVLYSDPTGHCADGLTTIACIAGAVIAISKLIDYGLTLWDSYQAGLVLNNPDSSSTEKLMAGLTVALAVVFELIEPDDLLPIGLPADDVARRAIMSGAEEALEAGGRPGLEAFLRENLGDHADTAISKLDEIIGITAPTNRRGLRNAMGEAPAGMTRVQAHHDLPWKFREWPAGPGRGLNVNDPQFGRWVEGNPIGSHQSWSRAYENRWQTFINNNPNASRQDVIDFLDELLASGLYP